MGTIYYSLCRGVVDAQVMKKLCQDAMGLGNHEFDSGDQILTDFTALLTNETDRPTGCTAPPSIVAASLEPGDESPLEPLVSANTITKSVIKSTAAACDPTSLESFDITVSTSETRQ